MGADEFDIKPQARRHSSSLRQSRPTQNSLTPKSSKVARERNISELIRKIRPPIMTPTVEDLDES